MIILFLIIGIALGSFFTFIFLLIMSKRNEKKIIKEYNSFYESVYNRLTQNEVIFISRINNTVHLNTDLNGEIQIMYFLDRQDVSIFQDGVCIYTSSLVKKDLIERILKSIWSKFSNQINDVVQISNNTFDKKTFSALSNISIVQDDEVDLDLDLDDILDRINEVGYNNLTDLEKQFLKNLNR
jgi:hypothetical protein